MSTEVSGQEEGAQKESSFGGGGMSTREAGDMWEKGCSGNSQGSLAEEAPVTPVSISELSTNFYLLMRKKPENSLGKLYVSEAGININTLKKMVESWKAFLRQSELEKLNTVLGMKCHF